MNRRGSFLVSFDLYTIRFALHLESWRQFHFPLVTQFAQIHSRFYNVVCRPNAPSLAPRDLRTVWPKSFWPPVGGFLGLRSLVLCFYFIISSNTSLQADERYKFCASTPPCSFLVFGPPFALPRYKSTKPRGALFWPVDWKKVRRKRRRESE